MGSGFDIRRRRRTVQPVSRPSRRDQHAFSSLLFIAALGALVLVVIGEMDKNQSQASISPSEAVTTVSTTPSSTISSSATPLVTATPTTTPTSTLSPSPIPTVTPTIEKTDISMTILNGSGTAGQANTLRAHLEDEGFEVRKIAVAPDQHATTTLYYQTGKRAEAELVAGFIPDRVLEFVENSTTAGADTLLIVVGAK